MSQSVTFSAPAVDRGPQALERVAGVVAPGVEEVLGVVDDPLAVRRAQKATESAIIARFSLARDPGHLLQVQAPGLADQGARPARSAATRSRSASSSSAATSRRRVMPKAQISGLLELDLGEQLEAARASFGFELGKPASTKPIAEPVERLRRRAPSRPPRATCPGPACRRGGWCRRAVPESLDAFRRFGKRASRCAGVGRAAAVPLGGRGAANSLDRAVRRHRHPVTYGSRPQRRSARLGSELARLHQVQPLRGTPGRGRAARPRTSPGSPG